MKTPHLEINNLTKIYNQGSKYEVCALSNINLKIYQGENVIITGDNASGESTLFNIICGTIQCTKGKVLIDGNDITNNSASKRALTISRVWQDVNYGLIPSLTVIENLALSLGKKASWNTRLYNLAKRNEDIISLLQSLGMHLEDKLDIKVDFLSGGQKQVVALMMAVICKPKILLLDEHTASLDPISKERVLLITESLIKKNDITIDKALDEDTKDGE